MVSDGMTRSLTPFEDNMNDRWLHLSAFALLVLGGAGYGLFEWVVQKEERVQQLPTPAVHCPPERFGATGVILGQFKTDPAGQPTGNPPEAAP